MMKMLKRSLLVCALLVCALLVRPTPALAQRFPAEKGKKQVVVHTRLAPVAVHRVLPPYGLGIHVYAGRR